jgi:GDPmannose 4,6-dehydratase
MPSALIIGVAGQDGSYLAELLLEKGYRVVGAVAQGESKSLENLGTANGRVEIVVTDLTDQCNLLEVIDGVRPDEAYNFASQSHLNTSQNEPVFTGDVSGLGVTRLLEAIRRASPATRFFQACSSEMFGRHPQEVPQTEETLFIPWNAYAAAKLYAHGIVGAYRRSHGLFACSAILYNHESPRRRPEFVTRKVASGAAMIKLGLSRELRLGNLETRRDWGFAGDFVRGMWLMLQCAEPEDFILATGQTHSVRDLCEAAFSCVGLDYREHVVADPGDFRPSEAALLVGNPAKARRLLGWQPEVSFRELVEMMVKADLESLRNAHGQTP